MIPTSIDAVQLRFAERADVPTLLHLIKELAAYEKLADQVTADEAQLRETLFGPGRVPEVLLAEERGEAVGYALFFHSYSTFAGRAGIYLEDLFVRERHRGRGIGMALLAYLAVLATERGCARLEWMVLDWNQSAIDFYLGLGARPMSGWQLFRVDGQALPRLASRFD